MNFDYLKNIVDSKWTKTLVMLHWVWSNKEDLFSLSNEFWDYNVFSLNWPISLWFNRFAWYKLDFFNWKAIYDFNEVLNRYEYIVSFINYIHNEYDISFDDIYLFWFSQWAIMSYFLLWKNPNIIAWIIALSWRILEEIDFSNLEKNRSKKVFIWHWINDNVLAFSNTQKSKLYIETLWLNPLIKSYNIWHSISFDEINDIKEFLK